MEKFKDVRIVDNFYQTSSYFPMPTILISTVAENGQTNLGAYSLCFPYYIAGKDYYAMILEARNSSNTAQNILRTKKCTLNFITDEKKYFKASQKARLCAYFNRTRSLEPKPFGNILQGVLVEQLLFTCQFIPRGKSPLRASRRKNWQGLQVILALVHTTAIVLTRQKTLLKTSRLPTTPSLFWAQGTW